MGVGSSILFGNVMHKRLFPKVNAFSYGIYYLVFPLSEMEGLPIARNKFGTLSFYDKDHGARNGSNLEKWARDILRDYNITQADGEIILITLPRVFGYVFNPVSFWMCNDKNGKLRAVLCEVNNTFGETHTYLCAHPDGSVIEGNDILEGDKVFHVSPFLPREGYYSFRFDLSCSRYGFWINYYDEKGKRQLITALAGSIEEMSKTSLRKAFWSYPLVTFRAIFLIHWQALKLVAKGIKYISRPEQINAKITGTRNITNL